MAPPGNDLKGTKHRIFTRGEAYGLFTFPFRIAHLNNLTGELSQVTEAMTFPLLDCINGRKSGFINAPGTNSPLPLHVQDHMVSGKFIC